MQLDRRAIEQFTASLAVFLLTTVTVGFITFIGDQMFGWDLFPPALEKTLGFMMVAAVIIIFSSVLVNVMINISLIALNSDVIVDKLSKSKNHEHEPKNH